LQTSHILSFSMSLALHMAGAKHLAWLPMLAPFSSLVSPVSGMKCGDLRDHYKNEGCCGKPTQKLSKSPAKAKCPYDFTKPACSVAEPQTPRDLSSNAAEGKKQPKAATLTDAQAEAMPLSNVHFHLGAEHKSDQYKDDTDAKAYDAKSGRRLAEGVRPGFMCTKDDLTADQKKDYSFVHCKGDVKVGKSYEIHYVHSSAGEFDDSGGNKKVEMADGLGGAAHGRGLLNPMVVVQAQIFQIVQGAETVADMLHGWTVVGHNNSVMYPGSTTGPSHSNTVCSPYAITWHVDKDCHRVSPESFDGLCKQMKDIYGLDKDLYPHGSRELVSADFVVPKKYVVDLA